MKRIILKTTIQFFILFFMFSLIYGFGGKPGEQENSDEKPGSVIEEPDTGSRESDSTDEESSEIDEGKGECDEPLIVLDWPKAFDDCDCFESEELEELRDPNSNITPEEVWTTALERDGSCEKKCREILEGYDNRSALECLKTFPTAKLVRSKEELVKAAKKYSEENNCCIKELILLGHGRPGNISIGSGKTNEECKYINGVEGDEEEIDEEAYNELNDFERGMIEDAQNTRIDDLDKRLKKELKGLEKYLCKRKSGDEEPVSTIYLWGCSVGFCTIGKFKMEALANLFDATIVAPEQLIESDEKPKDPKITEIQRVSPPKSETPTEEIPKIPNEKRTVPLKLCMDNWEPTEDESTQFTSIDGIPPLTGVVTAIGIYPPVFSLIPELSDKTPLPITDSHFIESFVNSIDDSCAFDMTGVPYKIDAFIVLKYHNGTLGLCYTHWGHNYFGRITNNGIDVNFRLKDPGREMIKTYLEASYSSSEEIEEKKEKFIPGIKFKIGIDLDIGGPPIKRGLDD